MAHKTQQRIFMMDGMVFNDTFNSELHVVSVFSGGGKLLDVGGNHRLGPAASNYAPSAPRLNEVSSEHAMD